VVGRVGVCFGILSEVLSARFEIDRKTNQLRLIQRRVQRMQGEGLK